MPKRLMNITNNAIQANDEMVPIVPCEVMPMETARQIRNVDVTMNIDVNGIVETMTKGLIEVIKTRNSSDSNNTDTDDESGSVPFGFSVTPGHYVGIYDKRGHGVYTDPNSLNKSTSYLSRYQAKEFETREDAMEYGRQGYCALSHDDINSLEDIRDNWYYRPNENNGKGKSASHFASNSRLNQD